MGMGHLSLRRKRKAETRYIEKHTEKHVHDFKIHCILEITNPAGEISYYNVRKCTKCNSFESINEPGNTQGYISKNLNKREMKLPIITADWNKKILFPEFARLTNVLFCKPDKK